MNIFQRIISKGLSCIPCNGKVPAVKWSEYQKRIPTIEEAENWSGNVGLVCGKVNGGLVCIDFDVKHGDVYQDWLVMVNKNRPEILGKLVIEKTPSGGRHVAFRTETDIVNDVFAKGENGGALIETRGEGGQFVCTPSEGYSLEFGSFKQINLLTDEETGFLISCSKSFNRHFEEPQTSTTETTGETPLNDYDSKNGVRDILEKHGWKLLWTRGKSEYYRRPGKDERTISASWNNIPDRFYCFSTSTIFDPQKLYKASAVYTLLEHNGDFNESAKHLFANGYGKKETQKSDIIKTDGLTKRLVEIKTIGWPKGKTTGWNQVDDIYSVVKGQFTVITGYPSHGKSAWIDALLMNLVSFENWKFAIFGPENYPIEVHYYKLLENMHGKDFFKLTNKEIEEGKKQIDKNFKFIDVGEDEVTLWSILETAKDLKKKWGLDGLVIDPWNEIELDKPKDISNTDFIGKCIRLSRKFARKHNIALWILVHPIKPAKDKDGKYPIPQLYDCEGSAHWRNKADNGICIYRPDITRPEIEVHVQKIKYSWAGKPGTANLKYSFGRYSEISDGDLFYD